MTSKDSAVQAKTFTKLFTHDNSLFFLGGGGGGGQICQKKKNSLLVRFCSSQRSPGSRIPHVLAGKEARSSAE